MAHSEQLQQRIGEIAAMNWRKIANLAAEYKIDNLVDGEEIPWKERAEAIAIAEAEAIASEAASNPEEERPKPAPKLTSETSLAISDRSPPNASHSTPLPAYGEGIPHCSVCDRIVPSDVHRQRFCAIAPQPANCPLS